MRRNCCHVSFAFLLKLFNFFQAFVGLSIILYSVWMLNQWNHHIPIAPPDASSPNSPLPIPMDPQPARINPLNLASDMVSGYDPGFAFELRSFNIPAPWFIYSFMGLGILLCCMTFVGCIAAESIHGCCLCFYTVLITVLVLLEAALVAFIAVDHSWEKDLPFDPTGELDSLRSFVEDNMVVCKWFGIAVVIIQGISLLIAIILRAMVSKGRRDVDYEDDDYGVRGPLLNPQFAQPSASVKGDIKGTHSDIWSSRIREKYGLNSGDKYVLVDQTSSASMKPRQ